MALTLAFFTLTPTPPLPPPSAAPLVGEEPTPVAVERRSDVAPPKRDATPPSVGLLVCP